MGGSERGAAGEALRASPDEVFLQRTRRTKGAAGAFVAFAFANATLALSPSKRTQSAELQERRAQRALRAYPEG